MKTSPALKLPRALLCFASAALCLGEYSISAVTITFFNSSQSTNLVAAGTTSDSVSSEGYLFTVTMDKLFTGGVGLTNPIGRNLRVRWPDGLEAQAVTAGPVTSKARIDLKRLDGQPFEIDSFTARLLANTAGAGAAFEIMPMLDGEDAVPDPFMYNASGVAGNQFSYQTPELAQFDAYKITLYVDFALMSLTVTDPSLPAPELTLSRLAGSGVRLSWPADAGVGYSLESSTNLSMQTWTSVTNPVVVSDSAATVDLEASGQQTFFRLRK